MKTLPNGTTRGSCEACKRVRRLVCDVRADRWLCLPCVDARAPRNGGVA